MKNKKLKIFSVAFSVLAIVLLIAGASFGVHAQAEDVNISEEMQNTENTSAAEADGMQASEAEDTNPFESLFNAIKGNSAEIMCALALAGSVLLTLLYKKGLIPFMTGMLGAIGNAVSGAKASADAYAEKNGAELGEIRNALDKAQVNIEVFSSHLQNIDAAIKEITSDKNERAQFKSIMLAQITLLYDIFMNSQIPQYQKDAVGERLGAIKNALTETDAEVK